ncbi:hypothetical protein GLYMA_13G201350v4 [Glycine max]|nr:hypothetical protein GLYMA_13G201350v4 [Glycine max]KAH1102435.1 hypothetical protein GYH30_036804 [Glycine max]
MLCISHFSLLCLFIAKDISGKFCEHNNVSLIDICFETLKNHLCHDIDKHTK